MRFPEHFYCGGAIAANQAEGAWLEDGKLPNVTDIFVGIESRDLGLKWNSDLKKYEMSLDRKKKYLSHDGIDFYHHFKED